MLKNVKELLNSLPEAIVTRDQDVIASYTEDFRKQYHGATAALLRPRNVGDVQDIMRGATRHLVPIVPQGGNTSYCAGATPDTSGNELVLSLERMTAVREIDPGNLSLTAEAGAVLSSVRNAALEAGLQLNLSLGSQESCRIGGNLSTNAGGISVLRYGMARELVLGLEVVLPDGRLYSDLKALRKDNSGYDVKQMFIGAEGTLGVITAASLKLGRPPHQTVTALLSIKGLDALPGLLSRCQQVSGENIVSFEYISGTSLRLLLKARSDLRSPISAEGTHFVLLEAATSSTVFDLEAALGELLAEFIEEGAAEDGVLAASGQQRLAFWSLRESIPEAEVYVGGSVKHDIAVRTSQISAFIKEATDLVRRLRPDAVLSVYGHVGDGNVHFNIVAPQPEIALQYKAEIDRDVSPAIYELAVQMGGTFSAEHGIGRTKIQMSERFGDPQKLQLMRVIKSSMDPLNIMNPGKVISRRSE